MRKWARSNRGNTECRLPLSEPPEKPAYRNTGGRVRYREYNVMTAAGNSVHDVLRLLRISQPRSCHAKAPEKIAG
jgi:hypothetical protein